MESAASFRGRFGEKRLLWQIFYAGYVLGLEEYVPICIVTSLDDGLDTDAIAAATGIRFFSREGSAGAREKFDERGLDEVVSAWEASLEKELGKSPAERWVALSPNAAGTLQEFSRRLGIPCFAQDWDTFARFSGKVTLQQAISDLELPKLPGRWMSLAGNRYGELAREFGPRFVVQADVGSTGSGTAMVDDEEGLAAAGQRFRGGEVWIAPHAGELSFNVSGVATESGSVSAYPSVQVVGQEALRSRPGVHCGNDFTATADTPRKVIESIREQTERIGGWIAARGFRGLFGLDFVIRDQTGEACVVDLNPRWQGSTSLQGQGEVRLGRIPIAAAEIAWQMGVMGACELLKLGDSFAEPLAGSQFFMKTPAPGDWRAGREVRAGIYTGGMAFSRPDLRLRDLKTEDEILVNGHNPRRGRRIASGQRVLRVCSLRRAIDPATGRLEPWVPGAARALDDDLDLTPDAEFAGAQGTSQSSLK